MAVAAEAPLCGDHSEASVEALPPVVEPLPLDDEAVTGGTCGKSRGVTYIRHGEIWLVRYVHNVLSKGYILIKKAYSADLLLLLQGHFSDVSEDEVEAVVVLEDANGLVVGEAVEAATVHLADLVTGLRVGEHQSRDKSDMPKVRRFCTSQPVCRDDWRWNRRRRPSQISPGRTQGHRGSRGRGCPWSRGQAKPAGSGAISQTASQICWTRQLQESLGERSEIG